MQQCMLYNGSTLYLSVSNRLDLLHCPGVAKDAEKDSFAEKLFINVVKNLELTVSNIHIRYEDRVTNPACPFSFGVTLHELSCRVCGCMFCTYIFSYVFKVLFLYIEVVICCFSCSFINKFVFIFRQVMKTGLSTT